MGFLLEDTWIRLLQDARRNYSVIKTLCWLLHVPIWYQLCCTQALAYLPLCACSWGCCCCASAISKLLC
jgi:hypothetical protein